MANKRQTTTNLSEAARKARNAYCREWQRSHPEAVRIHQARYWEKKAAQMAAEADQPEGGEC